MTVIIPSNGGAAITCWGRYFTCFSATGNFVLSINNQESRTVSGGMSIGPIDMITRLAFSNPSGSAVTVTFEVGTEAIRISPQVSSGAVSAAFANDITSCIAATPAQFARTIITPGTPRPLADVQTYFRQATILGMKSVGGTLNVDDVRLGASGNSSEQPYLISSGGELVLSAPLGAKWDFQDWYIDGTTIADGVVVLWT